MCHTPQKERPRHVDSLVCLAVGAARYKSKWRNIWIRDVGFLPAHLVLGAPTNTRV